MRLVRPLIVTVSLLSAPALFAAERYFHLTVRELRGSRTRVEMNLPVAVVAKAAPLMPREPFRTGEIRFCDHDFSVSEFRKLWRELPEGGTFQLPDSDPDRVSIQKQGGWLIAESDDDDRTRVQIPAIVIDALLSGVDEELNFGAAAQVLAKISRGDILVALSDDSNVRMWIDESPRSR